MYMGLCHKSMMDTAIHVHFFENNDIVFFVLFFSADNDIINEVFNILRQSGQLVQISSWFCLFA